MKKRVLRVLGGATLMVAITIGVQINKENSRVFVDLNKLNSSIALADGEINSDCENGCVWGYTSCYCYDYYEHLAEYTGW